MQINTSAQLIQHLNTGGSIKLSDNRLQTQNCVSALLEKVGDIFRSNQTIALRNERLALAVGYRLNQENDNKQLNLFDIDHVRGNQNIQQFTKRILLSFTKNIINHCFKDKMRHERQNAQTYLQHKVNDLIQHDDRNHHINLKYLKNVANIAVNQAIRANREVLDNISLIGFEGVTERQKNAACAEIKQKIQNIFSNENRNAKKFTDTGIYNQSLIDVNRDKPIISFLNNGNLVNTRIGDNIILEGANVEDNIHDQIKSQFKNLLSRITNNEQEKKIISLLASQTLLVPITETLNSAHKNTARLGSKNTYINDSIMRSINLNDNQARCTFTIDDNNINVHFQSIVITAITEELFNDLNKQEMGTLSYDISIPRSQFYAQGQAPMQINIPQEDLEHIHQLNELPNDTQLGVANFDNIKMTVRNMQIVNQQAMVLPEPMVVQQQPIIEPQQQPIIEPQQQPIIEPQQQPIIEPQQQPIIEPQQPVEAQQ
ncbi:MAG: hypothetical protein PHN64_08380 [Desulfovibrionaceae bacterium]|nr:hypothetical protein [Desulfovibrionaceae bacterium]